MTPSKFPPADALALALHQRQGLFGSGRAVAEGQADTFRSLRSRIASITFIGMFHIGFLLLLGNSLQIHFTGPAPADIQARIIDMARPRPPPSIQLLPVNAVVVAAPDIQIEAPVPDDTITSVDATQVLAPRPDPQHHNTIPPIPQAMASGGAAQVVLRILVLPDGSVSEAEVAVSSGQTQLDAFAAEFAKLHWRYLPAMIGTRAIQYWTTVVMRFAQG